MMLLKEQNSCATRFAHKTYFNSIIILFFSSSFRYCLLFTMNPKVHYTQANWLCPMTRLEGSLCFVFFLFDTEIKILCQQSNACKIHAQIGYAHQFKKLCQDMSIIILRNIVRSYWSIQGLSGIVTKIFYNFLNSILTYFSVGFTLFLSRLFLCIWKSLYIL